MTGVKTFKKTAATHYLTNTLNQSTDAISNAQIMQNTSSSFIKDDNEDNGDISFESQSLASSNMPSFDGSKMFARKNEQVTMPSIIKPQEKENEQVRIQTARNLQAA